MSNPEGRPRRPSVPARGGQRGRRRFRRWLPVSLERGIEPRLWRGESDGSVRPSVSLLGPLVGKSRPPVKQGEECGRPPSAAFRHHGPVSYGALSAGWHLTMSEVAWG